MPAQYLLTIALHYTTPLSTKRLCYYRLQRPEPLPASRDTLAQVIKTLKVSRLGTSGLLRLDGLL